MQWYLCTLHFNSNPSSTEPVLLGVFTKLRNVSISFVMSVCLSLCPFIRQSVWNNSAPTDGFSRNLIFEYIWNICRENSVFIKVDNNLGYFAWKPIYIHDNFFLGNTAPSWPGSHYRRFAITLRHTTLGRVSMEEWSSRRRDFYLPTHNTHKRQTFMNLQDSNPQSQQAIVRRQTP